MLMVVITIRKEVADQVEANVLYNKAKQQVEDVPGVTISGHTSNHFAQETTPE